VEAFAARFYACEWQKPQSPCRAQADITGKSACAAPAAQNSKPAA
jgi:hypothetical protein